MFSRAFNWWGNRLKTHPYSSNIMFGASVTAFGDFLGQHVEKTSLVVVAPTPPGNEQQKNALVTTTTTTSHHDHNNDINRVNYRTSEYNYRRTAIFMSIAALVTPLWLNVLKVTDKLVGANQKTVAGVAEQKSLTKRALKLRAVKQGLMTWAIGSLMVPFTVTYLTATFSIFVHEVYDFDVIKKRIKERLERNFLTHVTGSFCFWAPNWLPMFYFLPPEWRLVYGVSMNIFWQMCVSFLQHRPPA